MCLALVGWQCHPDFPLVLVSNRDEFYARKTRPAAWWGQSVSLLGGQDEEAGGTWLGINRRGRLALLTNVRAPSERNPHAPSRGLLVLSALQSAGAPRAWLDECLQGAQAHNGFNLLLADALPSPRDGRDAALYYASNRGETAARGPRRLEPGIYGLSNAALDTPWPKVTRSVAALACALAGPLRPESLLALMADRALAPDPELPETGVPLEWERVLSAIQIRANGYGTRATTVILVRRDGTVSFLERTFVPDDPGSHQDRNFEFVIDGTGHRPALAGYPGGGQSR
jgi:uncharacterized protein with NRDE domain